MSSVIKRFVLSLLMLLSIIANAESTNFDRAVSEIEKNESEYAKNHQEKKRIHYSKFGIGLYRQNFILPFAMNRDNQFYQSECINPNPKETKKTEFQSQISFNFMPMPHLTKNFDIYIAYTQKMFWQVYVNSAYFREVNYEPEIYFEKVLLKNVFIRGGLNHESNGRGQEEERSWNRAILDVNFSFNKLLVSLKTWILLFENISSKLHNPDIRDYMGNAELMLAYRLKNLTISASSRNNLQSGFKRGSHGLTLSLNIHRDYRLYLKYFHGYGQSLIEYNQKNTVFAAGIVMNDWI